MAVEIKEKGGVKRIYVDDKDMGTISLNQNLTLVEMTKVIELLESKPKFRNKKVKASEYKQVTDVTLSENKTLISFTLSDENVVSIDLAKGQIRIKNGVITKSYLSSITTTVSIALTNNTSISKDEVGYIYKILRLCFEKVNGIRNIKIGTILSQIKSHDIKLAEVFMSITDGEIEDKSAIDDIYGEIDKRKVTEKNKYSVLKLLGISKEELRQAIISETHVSNAIGTIREDKQLLKMMVDEYPEAIIKVKSPFSKPKYKFIAYGMVEKVKKIITAYKLKPRDVLEYLTHNLLNQGFMPENLDEYNSVLDTYNDYLEMSVKSMLRKNIDFFPRSLMSVHHIMAMNQKIAINSQLKNQFEKLDLNRYNFDGVGYKIITPRKPSDIIDEGNNLSHCVGGYVERIARGETIILFLREEPDFGKAFYTVEVKNNAVTQTRGRFNKGTTPEVRIMINEYNKFLRKKNDEDKKISERNQRELDRNSA